MNSFRGEIADFSLTQGCLGLKKTLFYPTQVGLVMHVKNVNIFREILITINSSYKLWFLSLLPLRAQISNQA